jgi:hypothetical protein
MTEALRVCRVYGTPLYGKRADTRTCGDSCRKSAQRVRQEPRTRDLSVTPSPVPHDLDVSSAMVSQISAHKTGVWTGKKQEVRYALSPRLVSWPLSCHRLEYRGCGGDFTVS